MDECCDISCSGQAPGKSEGEDGQKQAYRKYRFLNKCNGMFLERGKPVTLRIVARFLPPKSTSKKRTALMLDGKELPLKKPDIDNIVKVVADALNGVAYHDDTQIIMVVAKKVYSSLEGLDVTVEEYKG